MSRPKSLKPEMKNPVKPNGNDNLATRVTELEEQLARMKRDAEDVFYNIDSGNLGEELINRLLQIENNITSIQNRLVNIESRLAAVENS
ncbi:MAG: hypothetical protein ACI4EA_09390 [Candidatus Ornithomonoglobus sp.]